ncbi:expressed unknown protein [Seminavis robusta]|uniref:Uncharacterized protein n=1 Tax=Seminavis robusta TaxID=568900 RepID=A0A9N8D6H1_9STRA|nr:expressed unknown protein [Seminavis robusta]|eukprot:Sro12_g009620.1 n/a (439) ;mRNA; r:188987-190503
MIVLEGAYKGWAAAMCAVMCSGSFGVPIKSETCRRLNIDPLVFQTYKTVMFVLFSFAFSILSGLPIHFSPWGIVSGLFWVPGGTAVIVAINLLGLAVGIAVSNSLIALVSFIWGIFIFGESIHSRSIACLAVFMMILGFTSMSHFASGENGADAKKFGIKDETPSGLREPLLLQNDSMKPTIITLFRRHSSLSDEELSLTDSDDSDSTASSGTRIRNRKCLRQLESSVAVTAAMEMLPPRKDDLPLLQPVVADSCQICPSLLQIHKTSVVICGRELSRFQAGVIVAAIGGTWCGSVMIPMKFCHGDTTGLGYLISFSLGSLVVTTILWILRFLMLSFCQGSFKKGYQSLPSFHLQEMWRPGGLSGLLWSTGNCFSILSVHYLGTGVGYCVIQSSMLIAGIWGIVYFREIKGKGTIFKWFLSAIFSVSGIVLLAYEKGA